MKNPVSELKRTGSLIGHLNLNHFQYYCIKYRSASIEILSAFLFDYDDISARVLTLTSLVTHSDILS